MVTQFTPGNALWAPGVQPVRMINAQALTTSFEPSWAQPYAGTYALLLGVDITATQAEPVQCWAAIALGGTIFYWDSQSTGEGLGVTFAWRGQLPLEGSAILNLVCTSASNIQWGAVAWGIYVPNVVQEE